MKSSTAMDLSASLVLNAALLPPDAAAACRTSGPGRTISRVRQARSAP